MQGTGQGHGSPVRWLNRPTNKTNKPPKITSGPCLTGGQCAIRRPANSPEKGLRPACRLFGTLL